MRDLERLHESAEYKISPSQLRIVFIGVLAGACAIFAVGVTVGKRLAPDSVGLPSDPLAQLSATTTPAPAPGATENTDQEQAPSLTYHDQLTERPPARPQPEAAPAPAEEPEPAQAEAPAAPEQVSDEPAQIEEPRPGESSIYTLQVASFETRDEAHQFARDLRGRGHRVFLVRTSTEERGTWFRVRVGPFDSRRDATRAQRRFERTERLPTFLVQRRRAT